MNQTKYTEPTEEEISAYLQQQGLDYSKNWWHARETLRNQQNGKPPNGCPDWGTYWKTI
jgi:hypothetical protein